MSGGSGSQEKAYQTLAAYLRGGRLPHALLVESGTPENRLAFAVLAAKGALCSAPVEERPCGECRHCVKADKEIHPDLLRYGSEGGAKSFHIDTVRALRQQAYVRPNEANRKIFLLENVQDMSVQAQNALLKIIEEPPAGVHFILTCENKAALLETILSRVTAFTLDHVDEADVDSLARAATILYDACEGSELDALAALAPLERDRQGLSSLLEQIRLLLCDMLLHPNTLSDEKLRRLADRAGRLRLMGILAIIEDMAAAVTQNVNGLLLITSLCARIRAVLAAA